MIVSERTKDVLEWGAVLAHLAARCDSEPGRERAVRLAFPDEAEALREEIERVREIVRLADEGAELPPLGFADLRAALARAEREGLLAAADLRDVAELLRVAQRVARHLSDHAGAAPKLAAAAKELDALPSLLREIEACVDERGELLDDATPELRRLRERHRGLQQRTKQRIDEMLHTPHFEQLLQDNYVTVREGRYVLPFVSSVHKQLQGIVHHKSHSGATAFMETPELVELNNRLTMALLDVESEVERVLRELTVSVCGEAPTLARNLAILASLDLASAKARLARDLGGALPEIDPKGVLELRAARHPLMVLAGREVVANTLTLRAASGLVITGPNTGGKTVAMKTMGLSALMAAAALPVAASAGSRVPLFTDVHADIGDDQSIERSLSTFSGHVVHIRSILSAMGERALVLLDELCVGTDPHEGAALATAIMEELVSRGATLVVTTHYEELKAKAHADARFVNASFGVQGSTFAPSYLLTAGVPGRSGAVEIAARLGLAETIVARAKALVGDHGRFDEAIAALEHERAALEEARAAARSEQVAHERERDRLEASRRELEARRREGFEAARAEMMAELEHAREAVRAAIRELQRAPSHEAVEGVRASLGNVEEKVRSHRAPEPPALALEAPPFEAKVGARVFVQTFGRNGTVAELLPRKQQAAVDLGGARVVVPLASLRAAEPESQPGGGRHRLARGGAPDDHDRPVRTVEITCDLRGMHSDDALSSAETFLDRALGEDRDVVFFIHGHGTGALKTALRKFLRGSPYIRRLREGRPDEGGDGVTVAWLAEGP
jgi:DNA mismatch repair protein MutS2